jgi:hypothetical protein
VPPKTASATALPPLTMPSWPSVVGSTTSSPPSLPPSYAATPPRTLGLTEPRCETRADRESRLCRSLNRVGYELVEADAGQFYIRREGSKVNETCDLFGLCHAGVNSGSGSGGEDRQQHPLDPPWPRRLQVRTCGFMASLS